MTWTRVLMGLLTVCALGPYLPAQPILLPGPSGITIRASGGHGHGGHRSSFNIYLRSYTVGYGLPYSAVWPSSPVYVFYSPPPILVLTRVRPRDELGEDRESVIPERRPAREDMAPRREPIPPPPDAAPAPLPGAPASIFRPLRPADHAPAVPPGARPKAAERRQLAPPEERRLPRVPAPDADPKAEAGRQIALGKEAMLAGEYARAADRFRRATQQDRGESLGWFLLAQASFDLGKYREAVDALAAGLEVRPDWPTSGFRPVDLYGPEVAELAEHLERLKAAVERYPNDPVLAFLYGYELWFDGRQAEAVPLFRRALGLAPDMTFIRRFLTANPHG